MPSPSKSLFLRAFPVLLSSIAVILFVVIALSLISSAGTAVAAEYFSASDPARPIKSVRAAPAFQVVAFTATKRDALLVDNDSDGAADPGDALRYTVIITNTGPDPATDVTFIDTIDMNTTLSGTAHVSPIAFDDSYDSLGNVGISVAVGSGLLSNDVDLDNNSGTLTVASADSSSANGGEVSVAADGSFSYTPAPGFEGTDSFTYTVSDGDPLTPDGPGTVTITVDEVIWFVDNMAAGGGDGRLATPYNSLPAFSSGAADEAGDSIFLYSSSGSYADGITLQDNQFLIGQGATASIAAIAGITVPPHSNALPGTGGASPTITNGSGDGVTLAASNTLRGFDVGAASGFGVAGTSVGALAVSEVSINNTSGGGVNINGSGTMNAIFDSLAASGGTNGISLANVAGTFTANGGSVSGSSGTAVSISGGTAVISYTGTVAKTSAGSLVAVSSISGGSVTLSGDLTCNTSCTGVSVSSNSGGTVTFSGGSKVLNTGGSTAVNLTNNSGATINFTNGGLDIDTTSGTGFSAIGGGTINVTGTGNTIDTGASTGFNINDTIIGTSGVTFQSISVNGGGSSTSAGIILDDTGTGTFTVTGVGTTAGSGGTIQDILEDGIRLFNTDGTVSISNMIIEDIGDTTIASPGHHGVDGQQVDGGLTLNNVTIQRVTDSAIHGEALGGGSTIWNGLTLTNSTLAFSNRFHIASVADGGGTDEAMVTIEGISGPVTITGNDFDDGPGFVNLFTAASGSVDITVQSNTFDDGRKDLSNQASVGSSGVRVNTTGTINAIIRIGDPAETDPALGNVFTDTGSDAAIIVSGFTASDNADIDLIISQNSITVNDHTSPPGLCEPADGINNCAFDFPNGGIGVESRGSGTFEAIISQNTLVETQNSGGLSTGSLRVDVSGDDTEVIVRNNTLTRSWDGPLFIRADDADGNGARGFLLIQDNVYQSGPIGELGSGDDLDAHGLANSPSPFLPNRFQVRNGAILDLTVINDNMVSHDTGTNPQFDSLDMRINGDASGGTSSILNVLIQNTEAPEGFRLRNDDSGVDATDSEINLSRGLSTDPAATDINATQAESVLDDNGNTTGGGGASADVPFSGVNIVTTVPTLPSIAIATLATNEYYVKQDAHNSPQLFKLNPLVDEVQEAPYNTGASVAAGSFGMLANYLLPENRELQSDAPTLYDELSGHQMLFSGETMTVDIGDLPAGKSVTVVFDATVDNTIAANDAEVCNQATIQSNELPDVLTDDPDTGAVGDATCTAVAQADLSLSKTDSPDPVLAGDALVYTVTVSNDGPSTAQNVVVTDTLPAGLTIVSTSGCAEDPNGLPTCTLGTIPASDSAQFTIQTTVDAGTSGTITNSASVATTTHDPVSDNNTVEEDTAVHPPASITIVKDADPADGTNFAFTSDLGSFTLDDAVPDDTDAFSDTEIFGSLFPGTYTFSETAPLPGDFALTGLSCDTGSWSADLGNQAVTVTLAAGEDVTCTFSNTINQPPALANVAITSPIDENDTATLTGDISDPDSGDSFTLTVDWGDGSAPENFSYAAGTTSFSETHPYLDDNPTGTPSDSNTVGLTLEDSAGNSTTGNTSITVNNVPPTLTGVTANNTNGMVTLNGSINDVGSQDTFTLTVDWGDGSLPETFNYAAGTTSFSETHPYPDADAATTYAIDLTLEDDDTGVTSDQVTVTVGESTIFLPVVFNNYASLPDLIVDDLVVTSSDVQVLVRNVGDTAVVEDFWVDVYLDPSPPPTGVNQTWQMLADEGLVWGVSGVMLQPNDTLLLTIGGSYYFANQSNFSGVIPNDTPVYAQVDSASAGVNYGSVLETHESSGGVYNNIAGPIMPTTTLLHLLPSIGPLAPPQPGMLPERP